MAYTLIFFILALVLLITVHEFGHFIVARLCGVKVLRFSFGFGMVLARWYDKKGTEFAISLLPLGGYVKMLDESEGDVPPEERHLAFNNKPVLARIAIVLAGPLFNFIFAFFCLWLVLVIGVHSLAPIVDGVKPGSVAAKAGLHSKEEIIALGEMPVKSWRDFQYAMLPLVGTDENVGIQLKSLITGQTRKTFLPLADWHVDAKKPDLLAGLGIIPFLPVVPPTIGEVFQDSPAQRSGLMAGDKIKAADGQLVTEWLSLVEMIQVKPGKPMSLSIMRNGQPQSIVIKVGSKLTDGKNQGFIGASVKEVSWPKGWLRLQRQAPIQAVGTALKQTTELTGATFALLGRFATGKLALKAISGPVGIAQGAGQSARNGIVYYLFFLALVSISLGALNILPIPMLDGGHLLYYFIEIIIRRPLSDGVKSAGMYVGLVLLVALMLLALSNDISRLVG